MIFSTKDSSSTNPGEIEQNWEEMKDDDIEKLIGSDQVKENHIFRIILKCKNITSFFNRSSKGASLLSKELKLRGKTYTSLIQDVVTRWNSTYSMIERMYDAVAAVNTVLLRLPNKCVLLTSQEILIIPEILKLLKPFADLNDVFSSETTPTMSLIIPYCASVIVEVESIVVVNPCTKKLKEDLIPKSKNYFAKYEKNSVCSWATILDPRFKSTGFRDNGNYTTQMGKLRDYIVSQRQKKLAKPSEPVRKKDIGILRHVLNAHPNTPKQKSSTSNIRAETIVLLNAYLDEKKIDIDDLDNPLLYWFEYDRLPELKDLALKVHSAPSTSAPSKRIFSGADLTTSKRRTRLTPEHAEELVSINKNSFVFE